jgi:hypothetical protein
VALLSLLVKSGYRINSVRGMWDPPHEFTSKTWNPGEAGSYRVEGVLVSTTFEAGVLPSLT